MSTHCTFSCHWFPVGVDRRDGISCEVPLHLVEIGYGPSTPELLPVNPDDYSGHVGTDFIRNHQALGIDLASVHIYSDTWLPDSIEENHLQFVNTWMQQHIDDASNLLGMPIVIGEFGLSLKDGKFDSEFRETFMQGERNDWRRLLSVAALP